MLGEIKTAMRISHDKLDSDIQQNIAAAIADLNRVGIAAEVDSEEPLIISACEIYCKWQYDYLGKADLYRKNYESLRVALAISSDYKAVATDV